MLMREHDWSMTPLGPPEGWPQPLRTVVRLILNTGHPMYIWWGPDLLCFYNDAYRQSIGSERHPGSLGRPARAVWHEIWPIIGPQIDQVISGGGATWHENHLVPITRNGRLEEVYWTYSYSPIDDDSAPNGVGGVLVVCTETTAQVQAMREKAAELERLDRMFRQAPGAVAILRGPRHVFDIVNPAYERLVGNRDILGKAVADVLPEIAAQGFIDLLDHVYRTGETHVGRASPVSLLRTSGAEAEQRFLDFVYQPLINDAREVTGIFVQATDVTDVAHAEAALRDLNTELEGRVEAEIAERLKAEDALRQSQKMEAVGQLTGGLAHDFNNLLTGISGSLELLEIRLRQGRVTELGRYVVAAREAATRAAALTHRLLAFSRRQTLDPRPIAVNRLIAAMEELIRRTVGPAITVEVAGASDLWTVLADPNQLENALLNLCINARDAMPDGGRLTIATANRWIDERDGRERDLKPGQYLSLCVSDTGSGMTPDVIAHAFEPFFTTKPIGMGTGLGLSMIYGFARQSGGQVRINSEPGQGATVGIYLPRHYSAGCAAKPAPEPSDPPRAEQGETVLVVDDEPTVRMLVTEVLTELGYAAIEASEGTSALRLLQSDARFDLLITDVGLPGSMNGRQIADAGRELRPGLKVLFITGYAENAIIGNGHLAAGMHVLTKPFALEDLASRIRAIIAEI
jgi:signal transduction histidine kinase